MIKNKKMLIGLVAAVLIIGVAGFFVFGILNSPKQEGVENPVNINTGEEISGGIVKELTSGETDINNLLSKMPDLNAPIVIKNSFTPEVEKIYRDNIEAQLEYLQNNKNDSNGWVVLGALRKVVGDYNGAKAAWDFAILLNPQSAMPFLNLGELYGFYFKDLANAEKNYLLGIEKDPQYYQAYTDLADLYWADRKGVKQERIESLLEKGIATVTGPNKNMIVLRLARYYEDIKDFVNAGKYYEMFLRDEPNNADIQQKLFDLQAQ